MISVLVASVAMIPLLFVVGYTVAIGPAEGAALVWRARIGELLWNTVRLAVGCMAACAVIGTAAAWIVERSALPGRRVWHVLLVAPLAIPAFVNSFAWVSVIPSASGYWGALLVVTLSYYPLVYLPAAAALRGLDPVLEETARALGSSRLLTFFRVVLPQLRPAVLGGMLLVGLHLLAEFGALQMLRFPTFTTAIYDQYKSSFNGQAANMIAGVLVVCCLLLLLGELRLRGSARYSRLGPGSARPAVPMGLGRLTLPCFVAMAGLALLAVGVPLGSLGYWLTTGTSTAFDAPSLISTGVSSVGLAALAAIVTTAATVPVAWLYTRYPGLWATLIERSTYIGSALPGIVVALALVTVAIRGVPGLYQTTAMLLVAYAIMFVPRAMVSVRAGLAQAPPLLEEVSRSLGHGRLETARRITLPLIAPGLGTGAALVFLATVTELTATLLLAPIGTETLATKFWSLSSSMAYGAAAPYAVLMVVISAPATYLLTRQARKETAR
ncbi:MAG TPA: iron ABC transporter permease [Propionibacteriaceae bacterium]|nr:iron ABC transporter permease [Propionibacteriaceae bacterium]